MADYTNSKFITGAVYLDNEIESAFGRTESLLTPELLMDRHLTGINLVSKHINPLTGKAYVVTREMLEDYILGAVQEAEIDLGLVIMPTQFDKKMHYHRRDYQSWGYFMLDMKPISSLDTMSVQFADGTEAFVFPNSWIETANLVWGQVNLVPATFNGLLAPSASESSSSLLYLQFFNTPWVSALVRFKYTAGFLDGKIPRVINNYIGTVVAMGVLSRLAATNAMVNSSSINMDGWGQSVTGPGSQLYVPRLKELAAERELLKKNIRKIYRRVVISSV